ncbi:hypothetical protein HanHA300_Chr05g0175101 [Helianthus annuus]|nr:hypothetical protein HanHA300_Chr05g0175101 [Helianthus annuus]KAJ0584516.1 hypothetical protein HanHA89_Chr05g0189521 [Helianthus annuus]KAJ0750180.1 hypothetical protein HanLR1_Chr05g0178921 [Helianthus annuus]
MRFIPINQFVMKTWVLSQYVYLYKIWCFTLIKYLLTTVLMYFRCQINKHRYHQHQCSRPPVPGQIGGGGCDNWC